MQTDAVAGETPTPRNNTFAPEQSVGNVTYDIAPGEHWTIVFKSTDPSMSMETSHHTVGDSVFVDIDLKTEVEQAIGRNEKEPARCGWFVRTLKACFCFSNERE